MLLGGALRGGKRGEVLRFWEPQEPFVVVGYANQAAQEVNLEVCRTRGIPVLRALQRGRNGGPGGGVFELFGYFEDW